MTTRREMLAIGAASFAFMSTRALAQQKLTQAELFSFKSVGNVTLMHLADLHAQVKPIYFREPSVNLGVGEARGVAPHITGADFLKSYGIKPSSAEAYAFTDQDFVNLAKTYGRLGGLDRMATAIKSIRSERPHALLLDGGDTWQNSWVSLQTKSQDMVDLMHLLKPDAMTSHWEFTVGEQRLLEIIKSLKFPFLAQNIRENEFNEEVFEASKIFEKNGVKIAVIGQALPYTPISNPRYMMPKWSFGIREEEMQKQVNKAREKADLIVILSHNGFDVDKKLASRVKDIDVILCAHTHDALPEPVKIGKTLLVASGSHGKYLSRLDLDVQNKEIKGYSYRLIPLFSDVITADVEMKAAIDKSRAPFEAHLNEVVGKNDGVLYRRGNFNGTWDDLICDALIKERESEISLSPGFRWGTSLLQGNITREDVYNNTAMTYPTAYRMEMSGQRLKDVLEDVADNIFNPDPYLQQGGDMVRVGGISYTININKPIGSRIEDMKLQKTGMALEASKNYKVSGWASVTEGIEGPPIWDIVTKYIAEKKTISPNDVSRVRVIQ